jgi:hypothetical protein
MMYTIKVRTDYEDYDDESLSYDGDEETLKFRTKGEVMDFVGDYTHARTYYYDNDDREHSKEAESVVRDNVLYVSKESHCCGQFNACGMYTTEIQIFQLPTFKTNLKNISPQEFI